MESAYSLANAELKRIREKNIEIKRMREDEVRAKAPEFAQIEATLARCGAELVKSVLNGGASIDKIKDTALSAQHKKQEILKKLSLPSDYLDDIYSCEKCYDTGFDEAGRRCDCLMALVSKYIGKNSNITDIMKGQTFDRFDFELYADQPEENGRSVFDIAKKAREKAEKFADTFDETGANLYIYGAAGTGKTFLSSCIANRALDRGLGVYYASAFGLLDMLERIKFGKYTEDELASAENAENYAYNVDLLIIDDVGTEFVTAYSAAALFNIINTRLTKGKSTVISSNFGPAKIDEIYGTRMASRITGEFELIPFIGKDLRRIKK